MSECQSYRIQYFALLREHAGRTEETVDSEAATAAALYAEIGQRYGFPLELPCMRVAVNGQFVPMETQLSSGDLVVFIPPIAGG